MVYDLRKWNFVSKRIGPELWDQNEQIRLVFALRNDYSYDHFSHFLSHCHSISVWLSQTKLSTKYHLKFDAAGGRNYGLVESKAWQITLLDLPERIGDRNFQTKAYQRRSFPILLYGLVNLPKTQFVGWMEQFLWALKNWVFLAFFGEKKISEPEYWKNHYLR